MESKKRIISVPQTTDSIYIPYRARITNTYEETPDITTFRLRFEDHLVTSFAFYPGNFVFLTVYGQGEAPFAIASSPKYTDSIEVSVKRIGKVTQALHELSIDSLVGLRGPYGNHFLRFPLEDKNLIFVAGGIGMAPLRALILHIIEERPHYGEISIIVGAQTPQDIPYQRELDRWNTLSHVNIVKTVDPGGETPGWRGQVGLVPTVLSQLDINTTNAIAFVCGPPIMTRLTAEILVKHGISENEILTTLENRMACGVGKCGRCNIGAIYVCKQGPVFSYEELRHMQMSDYWNN